MSKPDITLYHSPMSRSVRVRWALEEMGLPYTLHQLGFITPEVRGNVGGEEFKAINPMQKVPAMTDGDEVILESVAMLEYLGYRYGPTDLMVKPDEADFARYLEWLHFGEGSMSANVNMLVAHVALLPEQHRNPGVAKWASQSVSKQLDLLASRGLESGNREFLAGDRLTFADMSVIYMIFLMKITKSMPETSDVVKDYFNRMKATPGWQKATAD
jgi:glutathione S-transferase